MEFNRAEATYYKTYFPYASSGKQNAAFSYMILRITFEVCFSNWVEIFRLLIILSFHCSNFNVFVNFWKGNGVQVGSVALCM